MPPSAWIVPEPPATPTLPLFHVKRPLIVRSPAPPTVSPFCVSDSMVGETSSVTVLPLFGRTMSKVRPPLPLFGKKPFAAGFVFVQRVGSLQLALAFVKVAVSSAAQMEPAAAAKGPPACRSSRSSAA